uniref:Uncharacterized protein n=1 Tax=Anopheles christyi TaxID=43041 RepID=A0A182KIQ7_9DIPT
MHHFGFPFLSSPFYSSRRRLTADRTEAAAVVEYTQAPLHGILATERAGVLGVLGDFHLLHHLTQRSTISGTVFTDDSDFPGTLGLKRGETL